MKAPNFLLSALPRRAPLALALLLSTLLLLGRAHADNGAQQGVFTYDVNTPVPTAAVGVPYSHTFAVTGGVAPVTYTAVYGTPPGLTLDSATCTLSGTPTVAY